MIKPGIINAIIITGVEHKLNPAIMTRRRSRKNDPQTFHQFFRPVKSAQTQANVIVSVRNNNDWTPAANLTIINQAIDEKGRVDAP